MNMPLHWNRYYQVTGYFVTYYGDIYPGYIYEFPEIPNSIFIIPQIHTSAVQKLQKEGVISGESLNKYGWEIKDPNIVTHVFEADEIGHDAASPDGTIYGKQKWKQMFVFGAGASSFCVPKDEQDRLNNFRSCPPIGNNLFSSKYRQYFYD